MLSSCTTGCSHQDYYTIIYSYLRVVGVGYTYRDVLHTTATVLLYITSSSADALPVLDPDTILTQHHPEYHHPLRSTCYTIRYMYIYISTMHT